MGRVKSGFTFLELVVVMMIIGFMATIVIPNLQQLSPQYKRKEFLSRLESLVRLSWQQALAEQKAVRIFFDLEKRFVQLEIETEKKEKAGEPEFKPASISYLNTSYEWSENIVFKSFYIGKDDILGRAGTKIETLWFYIASDGLAQEVIINMIDTADKDDQGNPAKIGLVLNPFTATFKEYDEFKKP
jgi:prepilin-type N-terminal cleavage/methylation domain-containing protein